MRTAALLFTLLCAACHGSSPATDAGIDLTASDAESDSTTPEAAPLDTGPGPEDTAPEAAPDDAASSDRQLGDADAGSSCADAADCTQWAGGTCLSGHCCYPDGSGGLICM